MTIPDEDHIDGMACPCFPMLAYTTENGTEVWVHNAYDGEKPPLEVMAEAIAMAAETGG